MYQMTETEYKFAELIWGGGTHRFRRTGKTVRGEVRLEEIHYLYVY